MTIIHSWLFMPFFSLRLCCCTPAARWSATDRGQRSAVARAIAIASRSAVLANGSGGLQQTAGSLPAWHFAVGACRFALPCLG